MARAAAGVSVRAAARAVARNKLIRLIVTGFWLMRELSVLRSIIQ
jgi:hypothetical protein